MKGKNNGRPFTNTIYLKPGPDSSNGGKIIPFDLREIVLEFGMEQIQSAVELPIREGDEVEITVAADGTASAVLRNSRRPEQ